MSKQALIYVNGRFAAQNLSGVQRFAIEITSAMQKLRLENVQLLLPPGTETKIARASVVGRLKGQAWEQWDLPKYAAGGILVNLGNTAPLRLKRQIIVIHDTGIFATPEAYSPRFRLWYKIMQGYLAWRGVPIVTVSEFAREEIIRNLKAKPDTVTVIPEGADHMNRIVADETVLHQHKLKLGSFVLVVGNLAAHKNLGALGKLAEMLVRRGIQLVITGGLTGPAFQQQSSKALPQPALYVGRVSDEALKALYEKAACFVFPSRYEGFGLPAIEAMVCGCPVIASDIPALRESCGKAALFCDPYSPDNIAEAVSTMLDNRNLQMDLQKAGLEHTGEMTWASAAAALIKRIDTL